MIRDDDDKHHIRVLTNEPERYAEVEENHDMKERVIS